jgi:outer membrane protein assembly factor BamB
MHRIVLVVTLVCTLALAGQLAPVDDGFAQDLNPGPATPNALGPAVPPELTQYAADWPAPMGNLAGTRATTNAAITAANVAQLQVAWRFPIAATSGYGGMSATPLIVGDTVYVQDMQSNVFALDRNDGTVQWEHRYDTTSIGPNGLAIGYGLLYGTIGDTAEVFALRADTGTEVWRIRLSHHGGEGVDMAPTVYDNTVYVSTVPGNSTSFYGGGRKGILYALDAPTGTVLWQFDTTTDNLWGNPRLNNGGGLWYPLSVDEAGNLYFGTGNPGPIPGVVAFGTPYPNGSSRPGPNDYTNSLVSLDSRTGAIRWFHNAKPHDLFDLDFQLTPILATLPINGTPTKVAIGGGKAGTVIAFNADTGDVLWEATVGQHQNDELQTIPPGQTVEVLPGPLGGVETPMAYADGTVFVPVVNLPLGYKATEIDFASLDITQGTGELVALDAVDGSVKWQVDLPAMNVGAATVANDVVFTATLDGVFRAYTTASGEPIWSFQAGAGINAPPAVAGGLVLVAAAGPLIASAAPPAAAIPGGPAEVKVTPATEPVSELIALRLPAGVGTTPTP